MKIFFLYGGPQYLYKYVNWPANYKKLDHTDVYYNSCIGVVKNIYITYDLWIFKHLKVKINTQNWV